MNIQTIKNLFASIKKYALAHKVISGIVLVVILFGGYEAVHAFTNTSNQTKYVVATVQDGAIIQTVTGTGQVSASNQIDLLAKGSGNLTSVTGAVGQTFKAGDVIAQIDDTDTSFALQNSKLALQKLTEPADQVTLVEAQNALNDAITSKAQAQSDLTTAYANALKTMSDTFVDMPGVISGMNNMFNTSQGLLSPGGSFYNLNDEIRTDRDAAGAQLDASKTKYTSNLQDYQAINTTTPTSTLESVLAETLDTASSLSSSVKAAKNTVDLVQNLNTYNSSITSTQITSAQTNLNNWLTLMSGHAADLASIQETIQTDKDAITSANASINDKNLSLIKLQDGPDPIDVQTQELQVQQEQVAYDNSFITAPFDGTLATLSIKQDDAVTSGENVGTFITNQNIATISLNEVDAAKVQVGQKVTLTFDAIPDLTISGTVGEVDLVGTVSQGVVTYNVQIGFDTQDSRVRPGMSVNANIITNMKQNVITVPNAALKTQGGVTYVQIFSPALPSDPANSSAAGIATAQVPIDQQVQIGLADDTSTEITSGLNVGDQIVTKTIAPSTAKTTTTPSILSSVSGSRTTGAAGAFRGTGAAGAGAARGN